MTFEQSGTISAQDYNDLVDDLNDIYGLGFGDTGYGGKSENVVSTATNLPYVTAGAEVQNEEWLDLRNAMSDCALHQGTVLPNTLPALSLLEDADTVGFFSSLNGTPPNNVTTLTTNRFNINPVNHEIVTKISSTRTTAWGTGNLGEPQTITHEFTVTFTDSDHARHFFNTGGDIRFSASRSGGSVTAQNQSWTNMLANNSPYIFSRVDYFLLTGVFVEKAKFFASTSTTYGNPALPETDRNRWVISARRDDAAGANGGNGSVLRFKVEFIDGFYGPTTPDLGMPPTPVGGLPDLVNGTIISSISQRRSFEVFNIPSPVYLNLIQLNI